MRQNNHKDSSANKAEAGNELEDNRQLLTTAEVAQRLRVHQRTVQRWISSGRLPATKVGPRIWRISPEDLKKFLGNKPSDSQESNEL
ncbi:MAG: helix-turn-helix domain-containing protein [Coleofasciculus sp. D1-CHI-01]|uniref:helix-turn-helix domain-containing protein n=1 Tax=Coleofasciculus sp. D1-CHI-01 TaxID=3068482 RepID=UPI0032FF890F